MTEEEEHARKILGSCIEGDDALKGYVGGDDGDGSYVSWPPRYSADVTLDGNLSARELEALAWWMRNKGVL